MESIPWRPIDRIKEVEGISSMDELRNCICGRLGREACIILYNSP